MSGVKKNFFSEKKCAHFMRKYDLRIFIKFMRHKISTFEINCL
jgi:hypothetical protein